MPPDSGQLGSHEDWLARAQSNLIRAQQEKPEGVLWEDVCFDAQQSVERALKALCCIWTSASGSSMTSGNWYPFLSKPVSRFLMK